MPHNKLLFFIFFITLQQNFTNITAKLLTKVQLEKVLSRDDLLDSSKLVDQLRLIEEAHLKAAQKFRQVREMIQKYRQDGICDYCELIHKKTVKVSENFSELFLGFAIMCARINDVKEREYCIGHVNFLKQQVSSFLRF
uniref:Uncharacterized protein n=1 Tax=Globodera rostochiensis TaxID=31243 RepID=A0A914HKP1_GLORO